MKYKYINKDTDNNAILFFAGWGMDEKPFQWAKNLPLDFIIIYDYSNFDLELDLSRYNNIYVFAWSFGVYAASKWMPISIKPILTVAINGTPKPIDNNYGIPENIFKGTLEHLSESSLNKFNKRMCGLTNLEVFNAYKPNRSINSLKEELIAMDKATKQNITLYNNWDKVFISGKDFIFPTVNQKRFWNNTKTVTIDLEDDFHFPNDFQSIFESCFIDKESVKQKFENSFKKYDDYAIGQNKIAEMLMKKWQKHPIKKDSTVLEIGCGTGLFSKKYSEIIKPKKIYLNDIASIPNSVLPDCFNYEKIEGDAESCEFPDNVDYILSTSAIQWFENPSYFIKKTFNILNENGSLIISTFGNKNMIELRNFFKSSLNYNNIDNWSKMIEDAGYSEIEISEECIKVYYDSLHELIKGLKRTGVNALKSAGTFNKSTLLKMEKDMPKENGKYFITFNPIYIIAKK